MRLAGNHLLRGGEGGRIPTSAESLDQLDAVYDLVYAESHGRLLIGEERGLGGDDVEVGIDAEAIAIGGKFEAALGGLDGDILLLNFFGEDAEGGQVVLDLLERG